MLAIRSIRILLFTLLCLSSASAWAETVYKSIDNQGNVTFSDKPIPGAAQVQTLQITPRNSPQGQQQAQQLENQLSANNQQTPTAIPQRQQLQHQLKLAYAQLEATQDALAKAQHTANEQFSACLESAAKTGGTIVCKANDVSPLQTLVAESQAKVDKINTELDALPR